MEAKHGLAAAVLLLAFLTAVAAESIQGCGGFVEASGELAKLRKHSDPKLDFSHTTVELHTMDGLVKDRTQCAPNGYYYLPVYDKGNFDLKIKGPDGWTYEPNKVTVFVGPGGCNGNEDINFRYTGFSVTGRVLGASGGKSCPTKEEGPAGVRVILIPLKEDGGPSPKNISVLTSQGGFYKFENVLTGEYTLEATHPQLQVEVKGEPKVHLKWAVATVPDVFFVPGYTLEGSVSSQGNPVLGVHFYLHSDDVQKMHCPQGSGSPPSSQSALCHAVSDEHGKFLLSNVPCGRYKVVPYYKGENTLFDVSPQSVDVEIQHGSVTITKSFQVTGFSVAGRVVGSNSAGIGGVKIYVGDVYKATSDSQGFYKLDQVTSTHYTIRAEKEHYKFSPLHNFLVLPNMSFIPDINATLFDLCGSIDVFESSVAPKRQVQLTHGPLKPQTMKTDANGHFCFEVPPGEYRLSPLTTREEKDVGLLFSPSFVDVVVNGPVLTVSFTQAQVRVSGSVTCKDGCSPRVSVSLTPFLKLEPTKTDTTHQRWASVISDSFVFNKVSAGSYRLEIKYNPSSNAEDLDDLWCWEEKTIDVEVGSQDVSGVTFVQKGFLMPVESTHAAEAFALRSPEEKFTVQIKEGVQQVCLESPGVHELHVVGPCVFFGSHSFKFDTANPQTVRLVGQKYVLTGQIHIDSKLVPEANDLKDILVDIRREVGEAAPAQGRIWLAVEASETHSVAIYEYSHWAEIGDKLIFSPRHVSSSSGSVDADLLFYPASQHVFVEVDGCQPAVPAFQGRPGLYLRGSVKPALDAVIISVIADKDSVAGSLKRGEVALTTSTSAAGVFVAGPLFEDTTYTVKAEKEGYYLKPLGHENSFACQQLGKISVKILPGERAETHLPEVLLSLSGDDGYRKNAATGSGGFLVFDNLFPGSFYLRPFLKEYSFSPSSEAIEVESGEQKEVEFVARRVAFSVLGAVSSLSGRPEEGVYLEARSKSGEYYEETVSDAAGKYRLRGLLPDLSYTVKVAVRSNRESQLKVERSVPKSVNVKVEDKDIPEVNFVVFEQPATVGVSGVAEGENGTDTWRWQPHLFVEVVSATESSSKVESKRIQATHFFEFRGLPTGRYIVRLVVDLPEKTHEFGSNAVEVDLETKSHVHLGPIKFYIKERLHKHELTSAPVLPIVAAMLVVALFANLSRLKDVYQAALGGVSSSGNGSSSAAAKREAKKTVLRKRTY